MASPTASQTFGQTFRMNLATEPPSLDPAQVSDLTSYTVLLNIFQGLTRFGQGQDVLPGIAERWDVSADGLTYTFHLRKNARWSDGKPVTAQDFVYGWQRALDPKNAADYAFFLFELKNGRAFYEGKIRDFSTVGVRAVNDHLLSIQLERPVAYFLGLVAAPIALPVRQDLVEKYGDTFTEAGHYVTNGPFMLAEWQHEEKIVLKRNPYYVGPSRPTVAPARQKVMSAKRPGMTVEMLPVTTVEMLMVNDANTSVVMYENNELDFIETPSSISSFDVRRLRNHPDAHTGTLHAIYYFGFNTQKPPFNDPKVRQAFALALDRSYYPRLLQSGQRAFTSFISPGLAGYDDSLGLHYDLDKARKLLAEAGYPNGKNFPTVTLSYRTMYDIQKEAEIAQFLWKKNLGVNVRLENMDWKVFLSTLKQDASEIYRLNWYVDYPDPDSFMGLFISESGNNYTRWTSKDYDALVAQAAITRNPAARKKLYDRAQKILLEKDAAIAPVYVGEKLYLVKPRFQGLSVNELNLINLEDLQITDN